MHRASKRLIIVNIIGALFYMFCLAQWAWSLLPYLPYIMRFVEHLQPPAVTQTVQPMMTTVQPPSLLLVITVVIIGVAIIGATIYVFIKLPATIGKTGQRITKTTTRYVVPLVSHHQPLTPKKRLQITSRVMVYAKLLLVVIPVVLVAFSIMFATELPYDLTMLITGILALMTISLLTTQSLLAKGFHVDLSKIW